MFPAVSSVNERPIGWMIVSQKYRTVKKQRLFVAFDVRTQIGPLLEEFHHAISLHVDGIEPTHETSAAQVIQVQRFEFLPSNGGVELGYDPRVIPKATLVEAPR